MNWPSLVPYQNEKKTSKPIRLGEIRISTSAPVGSLAFFLFDTEQGWLKNHPEVVIIIYPQHVYGSVSAGREKWPFNVLFFKK